MSILNARHFDVVAARVVAAMFLLSLSAETRAQDPAPISVCTHPGAGFFMRDAAGKLSGLEFDLLSGFGAATKVTLKFVDTPSFVQLLKDTEEGRCQIGASTITISEDRKARFLFSAPYFPNRILVVQKSTSGFAQPSDLKDRRVAVVRGTISQTLVDAMPGVKHILVTDDGAAFQALLRGDADALACDSAIVLHFLKLHPELSMAFPIGDRAFFAFALPKDSKLAPSMDDYLKTVFRNGDFKKMVARHFGASNADVITADVIEGAAK